MTTKIKSIERELIRESIFIIGHVLSVDGRIVKIKLNKNKNHSHILFEGKTVKNVSVGGYVKIVKGFVSIIGKVEGEFISEEKYFNKEYNKEETKINRILQVSLFGHFEGNCFKQGIKEMPLIDNECFLLNREEFNALHQFYKNSQKSIVIGNLTEEPSQTIRLGANNLFASHIGIFGNTGSGKSNTLAKIYTELFKEFDNLEEFKKRSDFVIIDFNGEYIGDDMITINKTVYELSTGKDGSKKKYPITKENLNKVEVLSVLLEATEKPKSRLDRVVRNDYLDDEEKFNNRVIFDIEEICRNIIDKKDKNIREGVVVEVFGRLLNLVSDESEEGIKNIKKDIENNLHFHSGTNDYYWSTTDTSNFNNNTPIYDNKIKTAVDSLKFKNDEFSKLKLKIILNYFRETIKGYSNQEHIGPLIGRTFRKFDMLEKLIEVNGETDINNLTVLCLRDVNIEMKKIIPLIVCKQLYEKKKESNNKTSLHIIVDEAHNILSTMSQRESETWKDYRLETFEEIIKEGRKFGVFLTIASQRPYDISPTIISQLHNYFIHRLINDNDINAVEKAVAYLDKLSFQSIPILPVGSCFVAGLASDIPVKVDIDLLEENKRPKSGTVDLEKEWSNNKNVKENS